jgi:hypothetical protein
MRLRRVLQIIHEKECLAKLILQAVRFITLGAHHGSLRTNLRIPALNYYAQAVLMDF